MISIHERKPTVGFRKRRRNLSKNRSINNENKKQKQIDNDIILSNITQPESIVLAISGLNQQQIVSFFCFIRAIVSLSLFHISLETSEKVRFTF